MKLASRISAALLPILAFAPPVHGQGVPEAPDRPAGEGAGPFQRLVIMGANLIDGTGAPMQGPVDIVIEGDRIRQIRSAGPSGGQRDLSPPLDSVHLRDALG